MVQAHQNGVYLQRPWLTALSYSGGSGSQIPLEMVLRGEIERPKNFIVLNADPGMEDCRTYDIVADAERRCIKAGIPFLKTARSLYQEILDLKASGATRFDLPPFWTRNKETGKRGRLMQGCTQVYKIAIMYRAMREWMAANIGVPENRTDLGTNSVKMWIGFSNDEWMRIKEDKREYVEMEYPLIERKMGQKEMDAYYHERFLPRPPRSVCNACYANDVAHFREMYRMRYMDWEQAVRIDEEIRDLSCLGLHDECYVSWTLIPLTELARLGFPDIDGEKEAMACHSGHCFV